MFGLTWEFGPLSGIAFSNLFLATVLAVFGFFGYAATAIGFVSFLGSSLNLLAIIGIGPDSS